jgi:molybdopterin-containing oxidoreductase family iron-sulfur binding subunit
MRREGETFTPITWEEAESALADGLRGAGSNVVLISGRTGPTLTRLQESWIQGLGGRRIEYEALSEAPLREAARIAFGTDQVPTFDFASAGIVYSFGADFLETWLSPVEHGRGFSRMSGTNEAHQKGRFVFIGPRLSLTGQNADEWIPVDPGGEALVALAVANVLMRNGADAGPYAELLQAYDPQSVASAVGVPADVLANLAEAFSIEGPGLAVGPGIVGQGRNATAVNLAVLILNAVAGSVGRTVHPQTAHLSAAATRTGDLTDALSSLAQTARRPCRPACTRRPGAARRAMRVRTRRSGRPRSGRTR